MTSSSRWRRCEASIAGRWSFPASARLVDAGDEGRTLAQSLLARQWEGWKAQLAEAEGERAPSEAEASMRELADPLLAILESCLIAGASPLRDEIVRHLASNREERRIAFITMLLRAAGRADRAERLGLSRLYELCVNVLTRWVSEPPRAHDDWSIAAALGCSCDRCAVLHDFLASPRRTVFEWPLAKNDRQHIHQTIDGHELPVSHQTRRSGRPYTLVLKKTAALFARDAERRAQWEDHLEWLEAKKQSRRTSAKR